MPFYTGKSADGSDLREFRGMYTSPCGTYWSNMPITREQKAYDKVYDFCARHLITFRDAYNQAKAGTLNLPKWCRKWLIENFEKQPDI